LAKISKVHQTNEHQETEDPNVEPEIKLVQNSSPDEITPLKEEVGRLDSQLKEMRNKYAYLYADLENVKKRAVTERSQMTKFGSEYFAKDLLEVIDNLERSLKHIPKDIHSGLREGLTLTLSQFKAVLEKHGISPISTEGQQFNPDFHEAIGQVNSNQPHGSIVHEERRGYRLHDRLLRPSRVLVSGGPEQKETNENDFEPPEKEEINEV